jgi:hypothetical protein
MSRDVGMGGVRRMLDDREVAAPRKRRHHYDAQEFVASIYIYASITLQSSTFKWGHHILNEPREKDSIEEWQLGRCECQCQSQCKCQCE